MKNKLNEAHSCDATKFDEILLSQNVSIGENEIKMNGFSFIASKVKK